MSTMTMANGTLLIDDAVRAEAEAVLEVAHDRRLGTFTLHLEDGATTEIPAELSQLLQHVLDRVANGPALSITGFPDELSTTSAAEMLGVSRPTLMKLIANGDLAATKTGTHHRLRTRDVLTLRKARRRARLEAALDIQQLDA